MALGHDDILGHTGEITTHEVHVPEWRNANGDDVVRVRSVTIREWEIQQARNNRDAVGDKEPGGKVAATLLARCIVDENGARLFKDDAATALAELPAGPAQKLSEGILEASGLTEKSADDIEGNSDAAPSGDSSSN